MLVVILGRRVLRALGRGERLARGVRDRRGVLIATLVVVSVGCQALWVLSILSLSRVGSLFGWSC